MSLNFFRGFKNYVLDVITIVLTVAFIYWWCGFVGLIWPTTLLGIISLGIIFIVGGYILSLIIYCIVSVTFFYIPILNYKPVNYKYKVKEITLKNGDVVYTALMFPEFGSYGHYIIKNGYGYNIDTDTYFSYKEKYYKTKEDAYYAITEYKKKVENDYTETIKRNKLKKGFKEKSSKTMNVNFTK